jgi:hypothetical protein
MHPEETQPALTVIPAQAEGLYNSEAGQSSVNMRPKDTKFLYSECFALRIETGFRHAPE